MSVVLFFVEPSLIWPKVWWEYLLNRPGFVQRPFSSVSGGGEGGGKTVFQDLCSTGKNIARPCACNLEYHSRKGNALRHTAKCWNALRNLEEPVLECVFRIA